MSDRGLMYAYTHMRTHTYTNTNKQTNFYYTTTIKSLIIICTVQISNVIFLYALVLYYKPLSHLGLPQMKWIHQAPQQRVCSVVLQPVCYYLKFLHVSKFSYSMFNLEKF